jgi:hypothetical protein
LVDFELPLIVYTNFPFEDLNHGDSFGDGLPEGNNFYVLFLPSRNCLLRVFLHCFVFDLDVLLPHELDSLLRKNAREFSELLLFWLALAFLVLLFLFGCLLSLLAEFGFGLRRNFTFGLHNFYNYNGNN